ncbi:MAG: hypothetical protein MZV64_72685 [Ignavibacteriales bacterium]|nr:hypothetical protein [Ignavibacteriales bacterium]
MGSIPTRLTSLRSPSACDPRRASRWQASGWRMPASRRGPVPGRLSPPPLPPLPPMWSNHCVLSSHSLEDGLMKRLVAAALLALFASPAFAADVLVKIKTHSDAIAVGGQSQPARDAVAEQWYAPGKTAQSSGDGGFIVDLDKNMAFMINHRDKSYVALPLPIDIVKVLPPEVAQQAAMMQMTATVAPSPETRTIGPWPCTGVGRLADDDGHADDAARVDVDRRARCPAGAARRRSRRRSSRDRCASPASR